MSSLVDDILRSISREHGTDVALAVSSLLWAGVAANNVGLACEQARETYRTDKAKERLGIGN